MLHEGVSGEHVVHKISKKGAFLRCTAMWSALRRVPLLAWGALGIPVGGDPLRCWLMSISGGCFVGHAL